MTNKLANQGSSVVPSSHLCQEADLCFDTYFEVLLMDPFGNADMRVERFDTGVVCSITELSALEDFLRELPEKGKSVEWTKPIPRKNNPKVAQNILGERSTTERWRDWHLCSLISYRKNAEWIKNLLPQIISTSAFLEGFQENIEKENYFFSFNQNSISSFVSLTTHRDNDCHKDAREFLDRFMPAVRTRLVEKQYRSSIVQKRNELLKRHKSFKKYTDLLYERSHELQILKLILCANKERLEDAEVINSRINQLTSKISKRRNEFYCDTVGHITKIGYSVSVGYYATLIIFFDLPRYQSDYLIKATQAIGKDWVEIQCHGEGRYKRFITHAGAAFRRQRDERKTNGLPPVLSERELLDELLRFLCFSDEFLACKPIKPKFKWMKKGEAPRSRQVECLDAEGRKKASPVIPGSDS